MNDGQYTLRFNARIRGGGCFWNCCKFFLITVGVAIVIVGVVAGTGALIGVAAALNPAAAAVGVTIKEGLIAGAASYVTNSVVFGAAAIGVGIAVVSAYRDGKGEDEDRKNARNTTKTTRDAENQTTFEEKTTGKDNKETDEVETSYVYSKIYNPFQTHA